MNALLQLALHVVQWALRLWWVWCLVMLLLIVVAVAIGKLLGKSGKRDDERR